PTPPVTRITGASPRWYSAAAWSSRARNTGEGRPLYCAAPRTAIAAAAVAWSCAPASATATTTAAQPKVSATMTVTTATSLRRSVQKGMGERQQGKGIEGRGTARYGNRSGLGQDLLEEGKGARVAGLAEPEQRLAPYARVRVCAGDPDEGGNTGVARLLGQGEDCLLLHVPVHVAIVDQVGKPAGRRVAGCLAEPEHRLAAGARGRPIVAGELQEHGPDRDRVREGGGQNRFFSPASVLASREAEQEIDRVARRRGAEIGDGGVSRRGDSAPSHVRAERLHPAGPDGERHAHRARLAVVFDLVAAEAAVERDRATPSPPPALPADPLEGGDAGAEALRSRGRRHERPREHQPPVHGLMISSTTCAARAS